MSAPKGFVFSVSGGSSGSVSGKEPPDRGGDGKMMWKKKLTVSFKDMVMGKKEAPRVRPKVDLFKEKLARIEYDDGNPLKPMVHISDSVFDGLSAPWQDVLVVSLLGKSISYNVLKERLVRLWKLSADFDMMDIGHDFYMVKFGLEEDRAKVMDEGPWMIFDHYIMVQCWSQDFMSPTVKVDKTLVWIRFPGLNLFFYDESILLALATGVGKPVKVDTNTLDVRCGRFSRICVEVDLTKPVVGKVWMTGFWYQVEYEGLHRICTGCGFYGHLHRDCKKQPEDPQPAKQNSGDVLPVKVVEPCNEGGNQEPVLGDWMIVKNRKRNPRMANKPKENIVEKSKSVNANNG